MHTDDTAKKRHFTRDGLVLWALSRLADYDTAAHLPLDIAIDAASAAVERAIGTDAVDVRELCEEWFPDDDDVEVIEDLALEVREHAAGLDLGATRDGS